MIYATDERHATLRNFPALHSKTTEYGTKTYYEQLSQSAQDQPRLWFNIISYFCFGVPFIHRRHITLAQKNSELRGDEKTWPIYIDSLVREWSTFNIAVSSFIKIFITERRLSTRIGDGIAIVSFSLDCIVVSCVIIIPGHLLLS